MAYDIYCQVDGCDGEATSSGHENWIEVDSFTHSITQPPAPTGNSTKPGGKSEHAAFQITKRADMASAKLYQACAKGEDIPKVVVECVRAIAGAPTTFLKITMEKCFVEYISPVASGGGEDYPQDTVGFRYGKIEWEYTHEDGGAVPGAFDVTLQT